MLKKEILQEKIGQVIGLETAAQQTVEMLNSKGLLKGEHMKKLSKMNIGADKQEFKMKQWIEILSNSNRLDTSKITDEAVQTILRSSIFMETYLGENPDTQDALEFLCIAEVAKVTHYKVLKSAAKALNNKKFRDTLTSILKKEKKHLELCIELAKKNALSE